MIDPDALSSDTAPRLSIVILCGLLLLLAYAPALGGLFVWDDFGHVYLNTALRSVEGLRAIWNTPGSVQQYYPLTFTIFWMEYHLWGFHTLGYHLVNVFLHGADAFLLGCVLRRLRVPGAWLAAAIFAFHPVHVESVAWISELKNVESTFFYLASLWAALKGGFLESEHSFTRTTWGWYGVSFILFLCALLSKTTTCVLPVVFVLVILWKRGRFTIDDGLRLLPFFVAGLFDARMTSVLEKVSIGAEGSEWSFTFLQRLLIAARALCFYAGKLIVPHPIIFVYPRWNMDPANGALYLYPVAVMATAVILVWKRKEWGIAPLIAAAFFLINIAPALGFVNFYPMRYSFVADHFQYVASMGWIALFSGALVHLGRERWRQLPRALRLTLIVLCFGNLWMSVRREAWKFRNLDALWQDTLHKNPNAAIAHNDSAALAISRGDWTTAEVHLRRAIALQPALAQAHFNLGRVLRHNGDPSGGDEEISQAIVLEPLHPEFQNLLARHWGQDGRIDAARRLVKNALSIWPDNSDLQSTQEMLAAPKAVRNW